MKDGPIKPKVVPEVVSFADDCRCELTVEIKLPGVCEDDIELRLHEDGLEVSASSEDILDTGTVSFCCPVKPEEALTTLRWYSKCLLRFNPLSATERRD